MTVLAQKNGKFRFWSTISDDWLTDWLTHNEAVQHLNDENIKRAKLQLIEEYFNFPAGWYDKEGQYIQAIPADKNYFHDWHAGILEDYDTYYENVDKKYEQILKEL